MDDADAVPQVPEESPASHVTSGAGPANPVVSTHVLVAEEQVQKLRVLSQRTRIHQSDYLREAVDDLLGKYGKPPEGDRE